MILTKQTLEKIKEIIERNYHALLINVVGSEVLSEEELQALRDHGIDTENKDSLLSLIYYNNVLNDLNSTSGPLSIPEMKSQQKSKPAGKTFTAAEEHLNEVFASNIDKLKASMQASIEGVIRDYNLEARNRVIGNEASVDEIESLIRQSTVGGLKIALRDKFQDSSRDFSRIAITETANALGMGSIDRLLEMNKGKDLEEIYCFRIPVNDAALCRECRKFYLDSDGSPVVYKLTTLLANGSNYGKKRAEWKAVATSTHPNDRESGVLELKPGWKVVEGGRLDFIGLDAWKEYIKTKLRD